MKKAAYLYLSLFFPVLLFAQDFFRTMVPAESVLVGESFRVQYIIKDGSKIGQFINPDFKPLQLINGPAVYFGESSPQTGFTQSRNYIFTLVASSPGNYKIPGAIILIDGKKIRSNESYVNVKLNNQSAIGLKNESRFIDLKLRPDENVLQKINSNLFVKVFVDKKNCFPGEPVLATFKFYSRLNASSDIEKNPGFYGFTVYDMVNLSDKMVSEENINGKSFDVHTIRKVQLYPLQPGLYSIDAMEVKNKVELSGNNLNKKANQEITEGLPGGSNTEYQEGSEIMVTDISTIPVSVMVKPFIEKGKPLNFNGAVGVFNISASVEKGMLAQNEEGFFNITFSGKGNFIQLNAPEIQWPQGFEVFEPSVKDTLDKSKTPIAGSRIFRYPFLSAKKGKFIIPAISFSFFNPDSGIYKTVATKSIEVNISDTVKINGNIAGIKNQLNKSVSFFYWFIGGIILITGFLLFWFLKRRNRKVMKIESYVEVQKTKPDINDLLAAAYLYLPADQKLFYNSLYSAIWDFFTFHYGMIGSNMKKESLLLTLEVNEVNKNDISFLKNILEECETGVFTNASITTNRNELLDKLKKVLIRINN